LLRPAVDAGSTADLLVAGVTGLAVDVVHGTRSASDVREITARQLDQLFADATGLPANAATRR
jgi:hypothetical protein